MGDRLRPTGVERLARLLEAELGGGPKGREQPDAAPLGLSRALFFAPDQGDPFRLSVPGGPLETPIGVAAGPHTQMAQNIVAAWLMGARTIELKTVQDRDDIRVTRPCIAAEDEGYNCEWSQELPLEVSLRQYADAWLLVHVLRAALGHGGPGPGAAFTMSVGYDLHGILSPGIQRFLDGMADSSRWLEAAAASAAGVFPEARGLDVSPCISRSVTLSTMHGCPPQEIERIAAYLIEERGLDTSIKLNPTLLGAEQVRRILNDVLGYEARVPGEAFAHDLEYGPALGLIDALQARAARRGVRFGVKLTNTLETENTLGQLPAGERTVYMSGRALHPLAVHLALRLQQDFGGALEISFCGGADCWSAPDLIACGLAPVTVCTDLLKPGGCARLPQYLEELRSRMAAGGASSLEQWILRYPGRDAHGTPKDARDAALRNLQRYAERVLADRAWRKGTRKFGQTLKTGRPLTAFDCIRAPCEETCPVGQDVSEYMHHTAQHDPGRALAAILRTNPFPAVTARICDHLCQFRCTRLAYDDPLRIRAVKRFAVEHGTVAGRGSQALPASRVPRPPGTAPRVAVIGAGPSGLACAALLAQSGAAVEVFDAADRAGGLLRRVIPLFRLADADIGEDIAAIVSLGVRIWSSMTVDRELFERLRHDYDAVYVAVGAQRDRRLGIPGEDTPGVWGALAFLDRCRGGEPVRVGARVAVIGGGNSAVDAARVALRLAGPSGSAVLLYRRSRREMPADHEELAAVEAEGVSIREHVAPTALHARGGVVRVTLQRTRPGAPGSDGRPLPVPVAGSETTAVFDTVIAAIGQEPVLDFLDAKDLGINRAGGSTRDPRILVGGDALRGPASVIRAVADGRRAAREILCAAGVAPVSDSGQRTARDRAAKLPSIAEHQRRASRRASAVVPAASDGSYDPDEAAAEASRCLACDEICSLCVSVCPNRANIFWRSEPREMRIQSATPGSDRSPVIRDEGLWRVRQRVQVANIVDWCNECGNCTAFCPTSGSPYRDKLRLCLSDESFAGEDAVYRLVESGGGIGVRGRLGGVASRLMPLDGEWFYEEGALSARLDLETLAIRSVELAGEAWSTRRAAAMALLARGLGSTPLGRWMAGG